MTEIIDEPLTITVPEYAKAARVGKSTVYKAIADGQLPAIWVGSAVRLPRWLLNKLKEPQE